jgi:hypothetical protein
MWVCLSDAFVSLVAHRDKPGVLIARARRPGDLARVFGPGPESYTPAADYGWRREVSQAEAAQAIARSVQAIDYGNFKGSVTDDGLHDAYLAFWSRMLQVQRAAERQPGPAAARAAARSAPPAGPRAVRTTRAAH